MSLLNIIILAIVIFHIGCKKSTKNPEVEKSNESLVLTMNSRQDVKLHNRLKRLMKNTKVFDSQVWNLLEVKTEDVYEYTAEGEGVGDLQSRSLCKIKNQFYIVEISGRYASQSENRVSLVSVYSIRLYKLLKNEIYESNTEFHNNGKIDKSILTIEFNSLDFKDDPDFRAFLKKTKYKNEKKGKEK